MEDFKDKNEFLGTKSLHRVRDLRPRTCEYKSITTLTVNTLILAKNRFFKKNEKTAFCRKKLKNTGLARLNII